jgi:hypothetical protein
LIPFYVIDLDEMSTEAAAAEHGVTLMLRCPKDWRKWLGSIKPRQLRSGFGYNLGKMRRTICQTVASTHISDLAANVESPREILAALKRRLCPTEDTRENELLAQFDALQKAPKSQNFEKWTYEWREVARPDDNGAYTVESREEPLLPHESEIQILPSRIKFCFETKS